MAYTNDLQTKRLLYYHRFSFSGLCILTCITWKLQVGQGLWHIKRLFYYRRCLLSGLELYADWWVMPPKPHHSFLLRSYLCIFPRITWELQVIYGRSTYRMTALLSKTSLYGLELHEISDWRATTPDMHHIRCLIHIIVCMLQALQTSLFGVQLCMTTIVT